MSTPAPPRPSGIYETHLTVRDLETSIAFYRDILGLTLAHRVDGRGVAFFWVGAPDQGMLGLWETGSGPMGMQLHFAFRAGIDEILHAPKALSARGVQPLGFNGEPVHEPVVLGWMPALSLYFRDPDGHSLEYLAMLPEAPDPGFGVGPWSSWQKRSG